MNEWQIWNQQQNDMGGEIISPRLKLGGKRQRELGEIKQKITTMWDGFIGGQGMKGVVEGGGMRNRGLDLSQCTLYRGLEIITSSYHP